MNKIFFVVIFILSITSILGDEPATVSAGSSGLVLREGPGTRFKKITVIPTGEKVSITNKNGPGETISGKKGTWYKVKYKEYDGYCFSAFLISNNSSKKQEYQYSRRNETVTFSEQSTPDDVVAWWKSSWLKSKTIGLQKKSYRLIDLKASSKNKKFETYIFETPNKVRVAIEIPTQKPDFESYNYECDKNRSKLSIVKYGKSSEINLNPYCSETYDKNEVDIVLYFQLKTKYPLIEITTNAPACVPSTLYKFDTNKKMYVPVARQCGS